MTDKVDYLAWRREEESKNKDYFENAHKIAVHDALVAALQRLIDVYSVSHSPETRQSCWGQARAALKLAKD